MILSYAQAFRWSPLKMDKHEQAAFNKSVDAVKGLVDACKKISPDLGR